VFDSIQGRLEQREPTRVVVENGGIGYEVHVPLSTYERLPVPNGDVRLLLHTVIREDEWRLFGFSTPGERNVFRALLRVSGVGPMTALGLLSGLAPQELANAVAQGDYRALTRVKGVGRKTAERIVVELRDTTWQDVPDARPTDGMSEERHDAVAALVALGVDPSDARRRVEKAAKAAGDLSVSELVRAALKA
jgi:Holliday junction DNA helicase RuvA